MSPPIPHNDRDSDSDDSMPEEPLDVTRDDGWEDVEPEEESEPIVGLFTDKIYPDVRSMLDECREKFDFDLVRVQRKLELDFLGTIKLVNYIRSEVKNGNTKPDVSSAAAFEDEKYLKPVLEDDALLYSLDDIADSAAGERLEVTDKLEKATDPARIKDLENELNNLRGEFAEYKQMVQKALNQSIDDEGESGKKEKDASSSRRFEEAEKGYFTSYSYNAIHESMIKDSIRTDAYRDFIYDNKHLFKDKVVLDVGCGTGILSMFCAKAGAKQVIAVDNSDIIGKAREIVYENGFDGVITCLRGKIEEVILPVKQVDIIVSEWMGYCLLFEAMFDSVLWARDRYLVPGGLMVPSHATIRIAPVASSDIVQEHITFWKSIYGFNMTSMLEGVHDEAIVRSLNSSIMAAESELFFYMPLHTITAKELVFTKEFSVTLSRDIDSLDGWAVWFDIIFMPSADSKLTPEEALPELMKKRDIVAFTTGPGGKETHWQQGLFLIDQKENPTAAMTKGQVVNGSIEYQKKDETSRLLDITIGWNADGKAGSQKWSLA
ncbi:S-adenosylmethionine-dependent methyltransferase superfamily domain-containing protein [Arthroderma uncinatum]|uniref:S-adenosylmethionine-dependent methyltransferase superfamily domain-containing protein n=1 Tax=Arthroderma uncinatum TaxID=74035 RepID=UPI00144AB5B6|nr:S-adenosylmethionine-dependent methyltransferase superfamily domain-containing protein [Arthroderma uncinatum]KAF3491198.1 S-adenosylmethionine-dependent methyltransferase superfamily domain-containing protein [Arthroderma uncinatum]